MNVSCGRGGLSGGPLVMGILNVTPDSFSDGGCWTDAGKAVGHAFEMIDQGADVIDVGAESTRPYSDSVPVAEEIARLKPVLEDLLPSVSVPVSVDTMKTPVAEMALGMGADIINDVYGLRDEGMPELCAGSGAAVVIMHMHGMPKMMQSSVMDDRFMTEIRRFLRRRTQVALDAGVAKDRIILDPGVGFGKSFDQNLEILQNSSFFSDGYPVLTGSSRKKFLSERFPGMDRDDASAMVAKMSVDSGADIVRVHDVARTVAAIR